MLHASPHFCVTDVCVATRLRFLSCRECVLFRVAFVSVLCDPTRAHGLCDGQMHIVPMPEYEYGVTRARARVAIRLPVMATIDNAVWCVVGVEWCVVGMEWCLVGVE